MFPVSGGKKQGAFETSSKKKKNRLAGTGDAAATDGEWNETNNANKNNGDIREKSRNRVNARGGRGGSDSRGWRGRESRETENNASGPGDNKPNDKWQPSVGGARRGPPGSFRNGGFGGGRGGRSGG